MPEWQWQWQWQWQQQQWQWQQQQQQQWQQLYTDLFSQESALADVGSWHTERKNLMEKKLLLPSWLIVKMCLN